MAGRVARYGSPEHIEGGTFLFERGQRSVDFFLVVDGAIEMLDMDAHGASTVFTTHRARSSPAKWTFSTSGKSWFEPGRQATPGWCA